MQINASAIFLFIKLTDNIFFNLILLYSENESKFFGYYLLRRR
jgi:hypothetical protein